jgi:cytochrome P450
MPADVISSGMLALIQSRPAAVSLLTTPGFFQNPYPAYAALREAAPLHWSEEFFGGAWLVMRHADVEVALRDPRLSAQRTGSWAQKDPTLRRQLRGFQSVFARALIFLDAPDHQRLRRLAQAGFRPQWLQFWQPHIQQLVTELLRRVPTNQPFDWVQQVARPLPSRVMTMLMGLPSEDQAQFEAWSGPLADFLGAAQPSWEQAEQAQQATLAFKDYFDDLLARYSATDFGEHTLMRLLLQAQQRGEITSALEMLAQCLLLLFAGHETTRHLLANGLHALLTHPTAWDQLKQQPELMPNAIYELLRYESPVQYTGRRVTTEMSWHGHTLRRGELVLLMIGSANRDPARHLHPDQLQINRPRPGSLAFGHGPHVCLGAALSTAEMQTVLQTLHCHFAKVQITKAQASWTEHALYRGLKQLPLQVRLGDNSHRVITDPDFLHKL